MGHAVYQVYLGTDGNCRTGRSTFTILDDETRGADPIGQLNDIVRGFGMDDYFDIGIFFAHFGDMFGQKIGVDVAVAFSQDNFGALDFFGS